MKTAEDQAQKSKKKKTKTMFESAAAVGGTSSIGMFHSRVGLVPCCSVCRLILLPSTVVSLVLLLPPPPRIPFVGFPSTPPVAPPPPIPLGTTPGGCAALPHEFHLFIRL